ncbi:MAG: hypothetical protein GY793_05025 [Proteobacteria bacterium]|nr:hypothetical protein [Pseudomonadota bacterium]
MKKPFCIITLLFSVMGCASYPNGFGGYTIAGGLLGGVTGPLLFGDELLGIAVGTLTGGAIGNYFEEEYVPPPRLTISQKRFLNENYGYQFTPPLPPRKLCGKTLRIIEQKFPKIKNGKPVCRLFQMSRGYAPTIGMVCLDSVGRWRMIQ